MVSNQVTYLGWIMGLSPELKISPPDTFLPAHWAGRSLRVPSCTGFHKGKHPHRGAFSLWQRYGKLIQCTKKRWMHRALCRCVRETLTENLCKIDHKLIHRSHTGWLHPLYPKPFWFQRQNNTKKQESKAKGKRNYTTSSGLLCQPYCNFWIAVI